jgi:hypothetical protein
MASESESIPSTTTASPPVSVSDDELKAALIIQRANHPTLGVSKLHAQLLLAHPDWAGKISEKRTKKIEGLKIACRTWRKA